jgi:hypothetical protein
MSEFQLELPGPLDFAASLEIFRRSGDDLLDRWDGEWLVRIRWMPQAFIPMHVRVLVISSRQSCACRSEMTQSACQSKTRYGPPFCPLSGSSTSFVTPIL